MKRLWLLLLLASPGASYGAQAARPSAPVREPSRIIIPGAPMGQTPKLILLTAPSSALSIPQAPSLIIPEAPKLVIPGPMVVAAARAMTEAEANPTALPAQTDLAKLAEALAPEAGAPASSDADRSQDLSRAFDGGLPPSEPVAPGYFGQSPKAPGLSSIAAAARSALAGLLPRFYKPAKVAVVYDKSQSPQTSHSWTKEQGHKIEIAEISEDGQGSVPSAFGFPGEARVSQRVERFMLMGHEYAHVLFDDAVKKQENHAADSAYAAMTEGFAVSVEQLLIDKMLSAPMALNLSPRDASDLLTISRTRQTWLAATDNHYSEGILSWRKAYEQGGETGVLSFLASLSARRLVKVQRADPAYQLAVGDPKLLSAYLGDDAAARQGLEAFLKASQGEALTEAETGLALAAAEQAGPEGWRRVFERSLRGDKDLARSEAPADAAHWWEKAGKPVQATLPAFALARLSPAIGAALAKYLVEVVQTSEGLAQLFERRGPNEKLNRVVTGAETLPWDDMGRGAWMNALTRWLL